MEKCCRTPGVAGGRNKERVQEACGEGKEGDISGEEVPDDRAWQLPRARYLGKSMEAYVFVGQEQTLQTGFFTAMVKKEDVSLWQGG